MTTDLEKYENHSSKIESEIMLRLADAVKQGENYSNRVIVMTNSNIIQFIKQEIAKGKILTDCYDKIVFQENPDAQEFELVIVPEYILEKAVEKEISSQQQNNTLEYQNNSEKVKELMNDPSVRHLFEKDDSELTEQERIDKNYMIHVFGKDYQSVMDEKLGKILNQVKAVEL